MGLVIKSYCGQRQRAAFLKYVESISRKAQKQGQSRLRSCLASLGTVPVFESRFRGRPESRDNPVSARASLRLVQSLFLRVDFAEGPKAGTIPSPLVPRFALLLERPKSPCFWVGDWFFTSSTVPYFQRVLPDGMDKLTLPAKIEHPTRHPSNITTVFLCLLSFFPERK